MKRSDPDFLPVRTSALCSPVGSRAHARPSFDLYNSISPCSSQSWANCDLARLRRRNHSADVGLIFQIFRDLGGRLAADSGWAGGRGLCPALISIYLMIGRQWKGFQETNSTLLAFCRVKPTVCALFMGRMLPPLNCPSASLAILRQITMGY